MMEGAVVPPWVTRLRVGSSVSISQRLSLCSFLQQAQYIMCHEHSMDGLLEF